jgi:disulfide bond formation protein DsbB
MVSSIMSDQRPPIFASIPGIVLLGSVSAMAVALASQFLGGLLPCQLCIWQRLGYIAAIALALATFPLPARLHPYGAALASLAVLATAGIALFHAGVEYHWWQGLSSCTGNLDTSQSVSALEQQLMATPVIPCDRAAWSMFGISMAGYNFFYAGALGLICLTAALRLIRRR